MSRRKTGAATTPRIGELAAGREREREDMLRYISEMTGELAAIAGGARMPMLTYFLNMARVEAEMQLNERHSAPMARSGVR